MSAEDRLRDAFRNLSDRAGRDVVPRQDPSLASTAAGSGPGWRPPLPGRPGLAIAGLAVVVAGGVAAVALTGGDGDQSVATDDGTTTTVDVADTDGTGGTSGDGEGATTDTTTPGDEGTGDTSEGAPADRVDLSAGRYRVATAAVTADIADPYLNVRLDPDPDGDLLAKLPATYTGLAATGETETAPDGGTWLEVELRDPVAVTSVIRATGRPPTGWVNAAFVEAMPDGLAVTADEVPACAGTFEPLDTGPGLGDGYLYAMESALVEPGCLRVVLTFGAGQRPMEWYDLPDGTGPAAGLPRVLPTSTGGTGASWLDLGPVDGAWPGATETGDGIYAVRQADGSLDLAAVRPLDGVTVTGLPDRGIAVVDIELGRGSAPPAGAGVVLTQPLAVSRGAVEVVGLARPFESTLGVGLEDGAGRPVRAVFSGSDFLGTIRSSDYGVGTTDSIEAWGAFAFRVEGLDPGDYTLLLDGQGGIDDPDTLHLPFTIDAAGDDPALAGEADQEAAMALVSFARGGDIDRVPLADEVTLLLGPDVVRTVPRPVLADHDAWELDVEDFEGITGPLNPLRQLATAGVRYTAGPIPHCASPARDWPAELDGLRQVNIEPVGIDSCIAWFGVHLFLDDGDRIAGVGLDLYGP